MYKNILFATAMFLCILGVLWGITLYTEKLSNTQDTPVMDKEDTDKDFLDPSTIPTTPVPSPGSSHTIDPDERIADIPTVRYKNNIFTPSHIAIAQNKTEVGCYIRIINESTNTLTVRLGPREVGKERGFPYPAIASGQSTIIDPRYGGITEETFYNMAKPDVVFTVSIGPTCR